MIYVPEVENYECYIVQSEGVIRGYEEKPQTNKTIGYRDYYINSSYIYKDGYQTFNAYANLPVCLSTSELTSDVYYRLDLDKILVIFLVMCIFCFYIPLRIFLRFCRRLK